MITRYVAAIKGGKGYIAIDPGKHAVCVVQNRQEAFRAGSKNSLIELADKLGLGKNEFDIETA